LWGKAAPILVQLRAGLCKNECFGRLPEGIEFNETPQMLGFAREFDKE
jgi:hypothetical protein